jgi:site-specific DNA-methyltransferase (adenine-specific)
MEVNKIYNENCLDTMAKMPDCFVDLTVTSPPYDNLRTYNGYSFDFKAVAKELYRVTKQGGVVVWVVADATINGSETGTSFRQALYFMDCGFNLHDTMIWEKTGSGALGSTLCYAQNFEYMFVFSKGKPKSLNLIKDRENVVKSGTVKVNSAIKADKSQGFRTIERQPFGKRNNIWRFDTQKNSEHPAPFPEQLANDHIISWSNEGDIVYDPFMGSGTTAKMAIINKRNWIGSEISEEYCKIIERRITKVIRTLRRKQ